MWFEVKILVTGVGLGFIAIVISQILLINLILSFLLFMGIAIVLLSEIFFGVFYTRFRCKYWMDKAPPGFTTSIIFTLDNLVDLEWTRKGPHGKRELVYNGKEASYIDRGDYSVHLPNGSMGAICHEKSEKNINLYEVEYAEKLYEMFGTDNIKEMYEIAKALEIDKQAEEVKANATQ